MNKCEGAFRLHRSVLATAERGVRLVSVHKDGLSQLLCPEKPEAPPRCSSEWGGQQWALPSGASLEISE